MDFTLSSDQLLIQQSIERFVAENADAAAHTSGFNRDHWRTFAELGWLAIPISEAHGGFGGSALDTMIVMEAFGAGLMAEPYVPCVVVAGTLLPTALVPALLDGTELTTLAYAEPNAGYDPAGAITNARVDGGVLVIDGRKVAVPYAAAATNAIVSVRGAEGFSLVSVPLDAPGVQRRDYVTYDERRASDITFVGVRVPASSVIGTLGEGLPLLERALDLGNVALCAEAVGIMGVLHRGTVDYLKTRTQFGRPIGSFQALQHRAVDMLVQLELARAITMFAASVADGDDALTRTRAAAAAKVQIADSARFVGEGAIQLHGAIGLTGELSVGRYVKRLTILVRELGDGAYALKRYLQHPLPP